MDKTKKLNKKKEIERIVKEIKRALLTRDVETIMKVEKAIWYGIARPSVMISIME